MTARNICPVQPRILYSPFGSSHALQAAAISNGPIRILSISVSAVRVERQVGGRV